MFVLWNIIVFLKSDSNVQFNKKKMKPSVKIKSYLFFCVCPHTPNLQCQHKVYPCFHSSSTCKSGFLHSTSNQSSKQYSLPLTLFSPLSLIFFSLGNLWNDLNFKYCWEEMHFQCISGWYCQFIAISVILFQRIFIPTLHLWASSWSQCLQKYCENTKAFLNWNLNNGLILNII